MRLSGSAAPHAGDPVRSQRTCPSGSSGITGADSAPERPPPCFPDSMTSSGSLGKGGDMEICPARKRPRDEASAKPWESLPSARPPVRSEASVPAPGRTPEAGGGHGRREPHVWTFSLPLRLLLGRCWRQAKLLVSTVVSCKRDSSSDCRIVFYNVTAAFLPPDAVLFPEGLFLSNRIASRIVTEKRFGDTRPLLFGAESLLRAPLLQLIGGAPLP